MNCIFVRILHKGNDDRDNRDPLLVVLAHTNPQNPHSAVLALLSQRQCRPRTSHTNKNEVGLENAHSQSTGHLEEEGDGNLDNVPSREIPHQVSHGCHSLPPGKRKHSCSIPNVGLICG